MKLDRFIPDRYKDQADEFISGVYLRYQALRGDRAAQVRWDIEALENIPEIRNASSDFAAALERKSRLAKILENLEPEKDLGSILNILRLLTDNIAEISPASVHLDGLSIGTIHRTINKLVTYSQLQRYKETEEFNRQKEIYSTFIGADFTGANKINVQELAKSHYSAGTPWTLQWNEELWNEVESICDGVAATFNLVWSDDFDQYRLRDQESSGSSLLKKIKYDLAIEDFYKNFANHE